MGGRYTPGTESIGAVNFYAGSEFPHIKAKATAKAAVRKYEPVTIADGKISPVAASSADSGATYTTGVTGLYGIALEDIGADEIGAVLLTGEVLADALIVAENVDVSALTVPFRNIGIFLE